MSQLEVDKVIPQSGTTLTLGESGDTVSVPSGATLDASNATLTLPDDSVTTAKIDDGAVTSAKITYPLTTFSSTGIDDDGTSTAITINSDNNVALTGNIGLGGATPTTSGTGITFPATASASTDANTLDDYEEGTWTPSFNTFVQGNGVFTDPKYKKVGRIVTMSFVFYWGSTTTATDLAVTGFPFVKELGTMMHGSAWLLDFSTNGFFYKVISNASQDVRFFIEGVSPTTPFTFTTDDRIAISVTYQST
jgi:hypothetical protein